MRPTLRCICLMLHEDRCCGTSFQEIRSCPLLDSSSMCMLISWTFSTHTIAFQGSSRLIVSEPDGRSIVFGFHWALPLGDLSIQRLTVPNALSILQWPLSLLSLYKYSGSTPSVSQTISHNLHNFRQGWFRAMNSRVVLILASASFA